MLRRRRTRSREVTALRDVDLDVAPGTAIGVVGANGAGKSTLLTLVAGILPPDRGTIETSGRVVSLLELGAGFHPDFTGRENVYLNASIHGMGRREVAARMDEIVAFSELERFMDAPVRTYSTGMYMRLGFAVASSLDPEILLLDEVLAVGDSAFQQKCMARIAEFQRSDATIVFVSHSGAAVRAVCDRAIWLANGRIQADGDPAAVVMAYESGLPELVVPIVDGGVPGTGATHGAGWRAARILAVRVTDWDRQLERFVSGEPFRVEVGYEVAEPVAPVVGIEIATAEGVLVAATDNRGQSDPSDALGLHWAAFSVESLPLLEGRFTLACTLVAPDGGEIYHRFERCAEFTVFGRSRGHGPVALPGGWSSTVPAGGDPLAP